MFEIVFGSEKFDGCEIEISMLCVCVCEVLLWLRSCDLCVPSKSPFVAMGISSSRMSGIDEAVRTCDVTVGFLRLCFFGGRGRVFMSPPWQDCAEYCACLSPDAAAAAAAVAAGSSSSRWSRCFAS